MKTIDGLKELITVGEQLAQEETIQNMLSDLEKISLEIYSCNDKETCSVLGKTCVEKEKELGEYLRNHSLLPTLSYNHQLLNEIQYEHNVNRKLSILLSNILMENFVDEIGDHFLWKIICYSGEGSFHLSLATSQRLFEHACYIKKRYLEQ